MTPAQDYVENDDIEEALTFVEKLKRWWDAALWVKRVLMTLKIMFYGAASTVVVGQAVDENFIQDAAIEVGIVQPAPIDTTSGMLREELMNQIATMQQEIIFLKSHQHNYPDPQALVIPPHPYAADDHDHPAVVVPVIPPHPYAKIDHTHEAAPLVLTSELEAAIDARIANQLPPEHRKLH